jgi:hypothetical protein
MTKKIVFLEKERNSCKLTYQNNNKKLICTENAVLSKAQKIKTLTLKCNTLESLCKTLQQERTNLLAQLQKKSNNVNTENKLQIKVENKKHPIKNVEDNLKNSNFNTPLCTNSTDNQNKKIQNIEKSSQIVKNDNSIYEIQVPNSNNKQMNSDIRLQSEISKKSSIQNTNNSIDKIKNPKTDDKQINKEIICESDMIEESNIQNTNVSIDGIQSLNSVKQINNEQTKFKF